MCPTERGFTLIEILLVMAMAAVLAGIALPSFEGALRKARRTDALVASVQIQQAQERLRSRSTRYGDLTEIGVAAVSPARHYALQITAFDEDGYALLASASGWQLRDAECRYMAVRAAGMNLTYSSGSDAEVTNSDAVNRRCWSL